MTSIALSTQALYPFLGSQMELPPQLDGLYGPINWVRDPYVVAGKEAMKSVQLPPCEPNIFNQDLIDWMKALFHSKICEDPTPGFGSGRLILAYKITLESYWVDKYLSTADVLPTDLVELALNRLEQMINLHLNPTLDFNPPVLSRCRFYIRPLEYVGPNHKQFLRSDDFFFRVVDRLQRVVTSQLCREFPPPPMDAVALQDVTKFIKEGMLDCSLGIRGESLQIYHEYAKKIFDERDRRMLAIFKESFAKDKKIRETNPNAPLTNFVTIQAYEDAIHEKQHSLQQALYQRAEWQRKKVLFLKVAAVALVFFFALFLLWTRKK